MSQIALFLWHAIYCNLSHDCVAKLVSGRDWLHGFAHSATMMSKWLYFRMAHALPPVAGGLGVGAGLASAPKAPNPAPC